MDLVLSTFNGTSITGYQPKILKNPHITKADIISVKRVGTTEAFAGKAFQPVIPPVDKSALVIVYAGEPDPVGLFIAKNAA